MSPKLPTAAAVALLAAACSQSSSAPSGPPPQPDATVADAGPDDAPLYADVDLMLQPWMTNAHVLVNGHAADDVYLDCRTVICRHNENTDMITWQGAIWLVHRTAISQTLGPNSALHVYRSDDGGSTFRETARIEAPTDRDIRDPCFYVVGTDLYIKALTRLPVASERDSNVDTVAVGMHSSDGVTWTDQQPIGPHGFSYWRVKESMGVYYTAAYQDGDQQVVLFTSTDGLAWTQGPPVYTVSADTPLETELTFLPIAPSIDAGVPDGGAGDAATGPILLALVRMDGIESEILGDQGRLRTKICWSNPPYASFACPAEFDGQRLDGPVTFLWQDRLFIVARKHLQGTGKKRTSLFEITGDFAAEGALDIKEWGEVPSAGDTSYAGVAMIDPTHALVTWYSGDLIADRPWVLAMFDLTDIWQGTIDLSKLQ